MNDRIALSQAKIPLSLTVLILVFSTEPRLFDGAGTESLGSMRYSTSTTNRTVEFSTRTKSSKKNQGWNTDKAERKGKICALSTRSTVSSILFNVLVRFAIAVVRAVQDECSTIVQPYSHPTGEHWLVR